MITKILKKKKNDKVSLYCSMPNNEEPTIQAVFLDDNNDLIDIDMSEININTIYSGLFFAEIELTDLSGGYLLGTFGKGSFCIEIEAEVLKIFFFNRNKVEINSESLEYTIVDNSGNMVQNGDLENVNDEFYEILLSEESIAVDQFSVSLLNYDAVSVNSISNINNTDVPSKGTILLNSNVWQQIAIPMYDRKIKEEFCDKLSQKYNVDAGDIIELCTAYFGNENRFRSFIPNITDPDSLNNFPLIYTDGGSDEISGIWVKMKDLTQYGGTLLYEWGS